MEYTWSNPSVQEEIGKVCKQDSVFLATGDTVLGLFAPVTQKSARRLNDIKDREEKPYLILVGSYEQAEQFAHIDPQSPLANMLKNSWPGPLTVILPAKPHVPEHARSAEGGVGLRVPAHAGLQALLANVDALFSTSANLSGCPVPTRLKDVEPSIRGAVDMIICDPQEEGVLKPSTIIDCMQARPRVIRVGAYPIADLEWLYGTTFAR